MCNPQNTYQLVLCGRCTPKCPLKFATPYFLKKITWSWFLINGEVFQQSPLSSFKNNNNN